MYAHTYTHTYTQPPTEEASISLRSYTSHSIPQRKRQGKRESVPLLKPRGKLSESIKDERKIVSRTKKSQRYF